MNFFVTHFLQKKLDKNEDAPLMDNEHKPGDSTPMKSPTVEDFDKIRDKGKIQDFKKGAAWLLCVLAEYLPKEYFHSNGKANADPEACVVDKLTEEDVDIAMVSGRWSVRGHFHSEIQSL